MSPINFDPDEYYGTLETRPLVVGIARWIGKSGYANHVKDPKLAWRYCLGEADGLIGYLREIEHLNVVAHDPL